MSVVSPLQDWLARWSRTAAAGLFVYVFTGTIRDREELDSLHNWSVIFPQAVGNVAPAPCRARIFVPPSVSSTIALMWLYFL